MKRGDSNSGRLIGVLLATLIAGCGGPTSKAIGPAGGTVTGPDGSQVLVPAGALAAPVEISVAQTEVGAPSFPPPGVKAVGATYAFTPHGTQFSKAVTVSVPFDASRLPAGQVPTLYQAEPGGAYAAVATTVVGGLLTAQVDHFSFFVPGAPTVLVAEKLSGQCVQEALTGDVWCWGDQGPLAASSGLPSPGSGYERVFPEPTRLPARSMTNVVASYGYVCGESSGAEIWCIGQSVITAASGLASAPTNQWVRIQLPSGVVLGKLAAGQRHVCGIAAPNSPDLTLVGLVYCWGDGSQGQLGRGGAVPAGPQGVEVVPTGATRYLSVAAGEAFTCAVRTTGEVDCWGDNTYGQVTTNQNITVYTAPTPRGLSLATTAGSLSASGRNACGLKSGGVGVCWGESAYGQRGDGATSVSEFAPLTEIASPRFSVISGGETPCGIALDGHAYCWGYAWHGRTGNGGDGAVIQATPLAVTEPSGVSFQALVAGSATTSPCALSTTGVPYCWGENSAYNLGLGDTAVAFSSIPLGVKVVGLPRLMP